ncbi:MAG: NAD(P)H-dependent oxidoreductase [Alphaproteobacteria bacterium]|nr:NAD(P)H-dependent oxidoreductase [Alphaproteobacteria bacterium]MBU1279101.1 NAD(P)H-dependent oxidoreductase [Alphaproteobacteria bacterium]MBU1575484.1 NAD(P)H-dependent oxidoreductase [Alphaproteobacteria bacterium]MBU1827090.1 NAD(P)H-dependent oxidoreductase [Alphaproteobacteria bacterium]MBU2079564.1 NAD(P)H-dependent oxidoreductase [Alphaproteobacteria bacterium]
MPRIAILDAHPGAGRFCTALADSYATAAQEAGADIKRIVLRDMAFDPILHNGYAQVQPLEPDLETAFETVEWCNHFALFYPTWWGGHPALLQGFFERTFLPGKAFKYHENDPFWDKLLKGRTAEAITTMDTPALYYRIMNRNAGPNRMKRTILEFTGMKAKVRLIGSLRNTSEDQRKALLTWAGKRGAAKGAS